MENVGAIAIRGLTEVLGSLAEIGYNAEWQDIRAEDVGAPHRRERIWILAYPDLSGLEKRKSKPGNYEQKFAAIMRSCSKWWDQDPADLPDTELRGCGFQGTKLLQDSERPESHTAGNLSERKSKTKIWSAQSHVGRVANGIPCRVDRLKGLGNSIVPQIAEILFELIKEYL